MIRKILSLVIISIFLSACGGGSGGDETNTDNTSNNQLISAYRNSIDGVWRSNCLHDNGSYFIDSIVFIKHTNLANHDGEYKIERVISIDSACNRVSSQAWPLDNGVYKITSNLLTFDGMDAVNIEYTNAIAIKKGIVNISNNRIMYFGKIRVDGTLTNELNYETPFFRF